MKSILMEIWELDALARRHKSSVRYALNPQPVKDEDGMWHWKDCQWMDGGLGFPQSGIKDYFPVQVGDVVSVQNTGYCLRVKDIRVEQLWKITDQSAMKEGCWDCGNYAEIWGDSSCSEKRVMNLVPKPDFSRLGWKANPWVEVIEFEIIGREKEEPSAGCKYCSGKNRTFFRCDVRTSRKDGLTEDVPVPVIRCPYCGRLLEKEITVI